MKTMLFYEIIAKLETSNDVETILKLLKLIDNLNAIEAEQVKQIATNKMDLIIEQMHN